MYVFPVFLGGGGSPHMIESTFLGFPFPISPFVVLVNFVKFFWKFWHTTDRTSYTSLLLMCERLWMLCPLFFSVSRTGVVSTLKSYLHLILYGLTCSSSVSTYKCDAVTYKFVLVYNFVLFGLIMPLSPRNRFRMAHNSIIIKHIKQWKKKTLKITVSKRS